MKSWSFLKSHRKKVYLLLGLFFLWTFVWLVPKMESMWDPDVAVLADIDFFEDETGFEIRGTRDWKYEALDVVKSEDYFDQVYKFEDLEGMSFYVQPLERTGWIAHTFVVFEFNESYGDKRYLGISVETRRELGEEYSILAGILNKFEITHIWATEKDLTERRTVYMNYELKKYSIKLSKPEQIGVLKVFLSKTQELKKTPGFYNSVTFNCTNALSRYINEARPGSIPFHYSLIFTGRVGEYLRKLGYVKSAGDE